MKEGQTLAGILEDAKIRRIPTGLLPRGVKWTSGMSGAIKMMRKQVKKCLRREGSRESDKVYKEATLAIVSEWNDGTWFNSWAESQAIGLDELLSWTREILPSGEYTENELCGCAFMFCVYLELKRWDLG